MARPYVPDEKISSSSDGVLQVIRDRWSPYCFDSRPVELEQLRVCLEAASWAASSYNEQPWYFIVAHRENENEFERALSCLLEANQAWAKYAGAILLSASSDTFSRNKNPNRVHQYDLGQAVAHFALQATSLGLCVHQMAGIHVSKIRSEYKIPEGITPQTALAVGYAAEQPQVGQQDLAARDRASRTRKELKEFVFRGTWGA